MNGAEENRIASREKKILLCIPGLGGHRSVFNGYEALMPEYAFRYVEVVDHRKALDAVRKIAREEGPIAFFCHCYGAYLAVRLIGEDPRLVSRFIIVEPFFAEFCWWRTIGRAIPQSMLFLLRAASAAGIGRRRFTYQVDYLRLAKYPMWMQPFFDMRWQNLPDYFAKIDDILTFRLPRRIDTPTFFILSPRGYLNGAARKRLFSIFRNFDYAEVGAKTHNIITVSQKEVAGAAQAWLKKHPFL